MVSLPTPRKICRFDQFEVDLEGGMLTRDGVRVKLQDQPFRILALLVERPGEIISREELRQQLWPDGTHVDFHGSLNSALKRLRAALGDDRESPQYVETVPKRGYRFIGTLSQHLQPGNGIREVGPSLSLVSAPPVARPPFIASRLARTLFVPGSILAVALVSMLAIGWRPGGGKAGEMTKASPALVPTRRSIAVIGFRNVSGKPHDEWLSAALAEMMSTELAAGDKLRIVPGEDVVNLKLASPWSPTDTLGQPTTSRIGAALNSDLLVLGSYTGVGGRSSRQLRLDVRLQDARTGEILGEVAEIGNDQNLFQLISRIGERLRDRLGVPNPEQSDEMSVLASMPVDPQVARFYALGLTKLRDYEYSAARNLFEQAIKADPKFPLAYSALSRVFVQTGAYDLARIRAKQAVDLSGHLSRLQQMEIEGNYDEALTDRNKGMEIYRALYTLYADNLDYGLQLAKLQLDSYHPDESLQTIQELRRLPAPARDDPRIDLREGFLLVTRDGEQADRLFHSAAAKAATQSKKLVYAKAEELICRFNRRHLQAPPECEEAYNIYSAAGNRTQAASCLQSMAEAQRLTGHNEESIPLYERSIRIFKETNDNEGRGVALTNMSLVFESMGQWEKMEAANRSGLEAFQSVNDRVNASESTANIADSLARRGQLQAASEMYRRSSALIESTGNKRTEYAHIRMAFIWLMQGDPEQATRELAPQVVSLREFGDNPWMLASAIKLQGDIQREQNQPEAARASYQQAIEILKKANASTASSKVSLAQLEMDGGRFAEAETLAREAIADFEKDKSAGDEIDGYSALARLLFLRGDLGGAREAIAHTFSLADSKKFPLVRLPLRILQAQTTASTSTAENYGPGHTAFAIQDLRAIEMQAKQLKLYKFEAEARLARANLTMMTNPQEARSVLKVLADDAHKHGFERIANQTETKQQAWLQ